MRRSLLPVLVGARLSVVALGAHDVRSRGRGRVRAVGLRAKDSRAQPAWISPSALLHCGVVRALHRHGKQLAIEAADGRVLVIQLGMSGQVLLEAAGARPVPDTHRHIEWLIRSSSGHDARLVFRDPRRFGGVHPAGSMIDLRANAWRDLGPDALGIAGAQLALRCAGSRAIKIALLDQAVLAGVGNIYADEALFRARISPVQAANRLSRQQFVRLAAALRAVLRAAIARGGSTLRDHRSALGELGTAQARHRVYGRSGLPCFRCRATIRSIRLGGRTTAFCPACQRVTTNLTKSAAAGARPSSRRR
ncbi:MAG: hypothetical protein JNK53_08075 [Phycisphaerae bacterium]|nr:hypothetical protein [Phycisphaerae bacterium]